MAHHNKAEGVPVPTVVISVIAVFVAGLLIGGFALRFGSKGRKDCDCSEAGPAGYSSASALRYSLLPFPRLAAKIPRKTSQLITAQSTFGSSISSDPRF